MWKVLDSMNKRTAQRSESPPLMQCQLVAPITKSRTVCTAGLISCRSCLGAVRSRPCVLARTLVLGSSKEPTTSCRLLGSRRPLADVGSLVVPRSLNSLVVPRTLLHLLQSTVSQGKNFLRQDGQLGHQRALLHHLPKLQSVWGTVPVRLAGQSQQTPIST